VIQALSAKFKKIIKHQKAKNLIKLIFVPLEKQDENPAQHLQLAFHNRFMKLLFINVGLCCKEKNKTRMKISQPEVACKLCA
jgi:hypothetical protein